LIAGSTIYDSNLVALQAIGTTWFGPGTQGSRMTALTNGVGASGNVKLISSNVTPSTSIDKLTGGSGNDWFWAKVTDKITDLDASDSLISL
jgi:hypothetical protein